MASSSTCSKLAVAVVTFCLLFLHLPTSECLLHHSIRKLNRKKIASTFSNVPLWMNQTVDHFNPQDSRTFQQRYYESVDYFVDPSGPIFLVICGESECGGIYDDFYLVLAQDVNAAYVTLEHRYYGESIPTPDLSTENLKYLTSKQALFDLATFRNYYQAQIIKRFNLSTGYDNPWIVLGGSYSGALSAWFRVKFPHLVHGSISSSGVINTIENYQGYDIQLGESLGPTCGAAYEDIARRLDEGLIKNATYIKSLFNATQLNDGDFATILAIYPAGSVQYGDPTTPCIPILEAIKSGNDTLEVFVKTINEWINEWTGGDTSEFSQELLKNTDPKVDVGRQWTYQQCSELGYFLTAASRNNVFLHSINLQYYLDLCANVFGNGTFPLVDVTDLYYGATRIAGSKILFLNGSQDPYRHASKQTSAPSETSILIKCYNCAHCVDINGCQPYLPGGDPSSCDSPQAVLEARDIMRSSIKYWISHKN